MNKAYCAPSLRTDYRLPFAGYLVKSQMFNVEPKNKKGKRSKNHKTFV